MLPAADWDVLGGVFLEEDNSFRPVSATTFIFGLRGLLLALVRVPFVVPG
jgi:hypothetical protein